MLLLAGRTRVAVPPAGSIARRTARAPPPVASRSIFLTWVLTSLRVLLPYLNGSPKALVTTQICEGVRYRFDKTLDKGVWKNYHMHM